MDSIGRETEDNRTHGFPGNGGIDVSSWYGHIGIAKVEQTYPVTVDYSVTVNYPVTVNGTYHADTNLGGQTKETEAGTITYGNGTWNGEEWEG